MPIQWDNFQDMLDSIRGEQTTKALDSVVERFVELQATADRRLVLLEKALSYLVDYQHIFDGDTIEDLNMLSYFIEDVAKELSDGYS